MRVIQPTGGHKFKRLGPLPLNFEYKCSATSVKPKVLTFQERPPILLTSFIERMREIEMPEMTLEEFRTFMDRVMVVNEVLSQLEWKLEDAERELEDLGHRFTMLGNKRGGQELVNEVRTVWFQTINHYIQKNKITEADINEALKKWITTKLGPGRTLDSGDRVRPILSDLERPARLRKFWEKLRSEGKLTAWQPN